MSAADDTAEVLRILTGKLEHYRGAFVKSAREYDAYRKMVDRILTETKCREMGHVDAESLIESLRQQFHEGLVMLTEPVPAGSVITTSATL
jgi:hypothetical protein